MLELRANDNESYQALLLELQHTLEMLINDPRTAAGLSRAIETVGHILADLSTRNELNASNTVLIVSGKSSQISVELLAAAAKMAPSGNLQKLFKTVIKLNDKENAGFYGGKIPPQVEAAIKDRKFIIFVDEYSKTYNKAISFLTMLEKQKYDKVRFVIFAGERVKLSFPVPELMPKILNGSSNPIVLNFLEALSRLQSELLRPKQDDSMTEAFKSVAAQIQISLHLVRN